MIIFFSYLVGNVSHTLSAMAIIASIQSSRQINLLLNIFHKKKRGNCIIHIATRAVDYNLCVREGGREGECPAIKMHI